MNHKPPKADCLPAVWALVQGARALTKIIRAEGQERAKLCTAARKTKWFAEVERTAADLDTIRVRLCEESNDE